MNIKLDENLPAGLARELSSLGHHTQTVGDEGLSGSEDHVIWDTVQKEGRFLITQDMDFSDTRKFVPGTHHGILLVRLHSPSRQELIDRIVGIFRTERVHEWTGCFVVATELKVRVLRPSNT